VSKYQFVTITVNGEERQVTRRTMSAAETFAALGLPSDARVAYSHAKECWLDFSRGWGFAEGQVYVSEGYDPDATPADASWEQDADWWKKG
jgi:hypothetical protein